MGEWKWIATEDRGGTLELTRKNDLASRRCRPTSEGVAPLSYKEAEELLPQVHGWQLADRALEREFIFKDFNQAIAFVNSVASIAEAEGHHPNLNIRYNRVQVQLWTHDVSGLTLNDFIVAAKVNEIH